MSEQKRAIEVINKRLARLEALEIVLPERAIEVVDKLLSRVEALETALREIDIACFKLCAHHDFVTGHGDTVAAMLKKIDAQISARIALDKDAGIGCGKSVIEPWNATLDKDTGK